MNPLRFVAEYIFKDTLQEKGSSLTMARLCTSRHLNDLQWVATIVVMVAIFILVCSEISVLVDANSRKLLHQIASFGVPHGALATGLIAATFGILNWLYQSGNLRLGSIDLFGCEISVICRVCLVSNLAQSSVDRARRKIAAHGAVLTGGTVEPTGRTESMDSGASRKFTSEEHYTPVYDTQISELIPLDVDVVTTVTQFYTYRKTMMDFLRSMAAADDEGSAYDLDVQMIYMQFLMYESARLAITCLVEFEPNRAESVVNILCSEITAYSFLQVYYSDDYRGKRLRLRGPEYGAIVKTLHDRILAHKTRPQWARALTTVEELVSRYHEMCACTGLTPDL